MPQKYRVTLSDGRAFDVTTEGGPPSEQDVLGSLGGGVPETPAAPVAPAVPRHPYARIADAAGGAVMDAIGFAKQAVTAPVETAKSVGKGLLQSQYETYKKADAEMAAGNPVKSGLYRMAAFTPVAGPMAATMTERAAAGEGPELVGEAFTDLAMGGAGSLTLKGAKAAFGPAARAARATKKAAAVGAAVEGDVAMAIPASKSSPWSVEDLRAAKPYINEQAKRAPITSMVEFRDALDGAIGEIEARASSYAAAFPEASLQVDVQKALTAAFRDNPRGDALAQGMRELSDLPLDRPLALPELDRLRQQLNAENKAILKKNNYDRATARKVDAGFAARESVANEIRDTLYGYYEARGLEGVRQLRRDEGSVIKIRNAAERQALAGGRGVAGTNETGIVREAAAQLVDKGAMAAGAAVGSTMGPVGTAAGAVVGGQAGAKLASKVRGARLTRDELVARAFAKADDRLPAYPTVPARRPIAGELGPGAIAAGAGPDASYVRGVPAEPARRTVRGELPPSREPIAAGPGPDPSGPIAPTLPEHYTREKATMDEIFGEQSTPVTAAPDERTFVMRWLADDLKEIRYQAASRMRGVHAIDEHEARAYGDKDTSYAPRVAGTPTQEMFHALGIKGSRLEIADRLDRFVRGEKVKGRAQLEALADAMSEAWDGQRFDFDNLSDQTIIRLGVRRKDLRSPVLGPNPNDMPDVYERFFPKATPEADADTDFNFADDEPAAAPKKTVKAFHGSPHNFDEFSADKIGTGEGAQAYGHGLYFAEEEGVARTYRDELSPKAKGRMYEVSIDADPDDFIDWDQPITKKQADAAFASLGDVRPVKLRSGHYGLTMVGKDGSGKIIQGVNEATAEDALRMLRLSFDELTGKNADALLAGIHGDKAIAARALSDAGVPGIKYLDQGSRGTSGGELIDTFQKDGKWFSKIRVKNRAGAGFSEPTDTFTTSAPHATKEAAEEWAQSKINQGTRNYVVFDPRLVKIVKKYGVAGALTAGLLNELEAEQMREQGFK